MIFLDELSLFRRDVLEALRGPLEDRYVRISRSEGTVRFPCEFALVAAMNPCPCGYLNDSRQHCRCSDQALIAHRTRISGPLLDRFDLVLSVDPLSKEQLLGPPDGEASFTVRTRVEEARAVQLARYRDAGVTNASGPQQAVEEILRLSRPIRARIGKAIEDMQLSARGMVRTLRVARTVADLAGSEAVEDEHVAEALNLRPASQELALTT